MLAAGQVAPTTSAWRPGAAGWAAVSTYAELGRAAPRRRHPRRRGRDAALRPPSS